MRVPGADADYTTLIERHAAVVRSAIRRVLGRRHTELSDDVEQELRLALWKRVQGGKEIEHPVSYLYRAAVTTAWAVLKHEAPKEAELEAVEIAAPGQDPEAGLLIDEMLGHLPAEQSRAVKAYLAGFNHTEIAALYGWSPSVARHRIYRALDTLRRRFAGDGNA